ADPDFRLAVNLAPELAGSVDLPDRLNAIVSKHGVSPANLIFEITENSILNVDVVTLEVLSRLRVLGYELAIDDFGTGSSNIQTLRDFPFSELKIDRSFICDALTNSFSAQTVKAAIALAADQKMKVVAEGVEDMQTWDMLKDLSVEQVQGYLVSKAMPIDEFEQYLLDNAGGVELALAS
ncbi:MAG: EAL domain-containing protein, partial [Pseudomonadota bacterium]